MRKFKQKRSNLSDRVENINYSAVRKAFSAGRKEGVINLTVGQPDFETPQYLRLSAQKSIEAGNNKYTETKGVLKLRQEISKKMAANGIRRSEEEIIITSGTTSAIFMTLFSLINPGDEVIVFSPYFIAYTEIINFLGGVPVVVKTDENFQPSSTQMEEKLSDKTKAIILNSPNNPTGITYSRSVIEKIVAIARKNGIYLISDEIYSSLVFNDATFFSPATIYEDTIIVDGLSKSHAVTGWRIGYISGPQEVIDATEKIQQFTSVCAPSVFQYAAIDGMSTAVDKKTILSYEKRRDLMYDGLKDFFNVIKPTGAFYFFLKTPVSGSIFTQLVLDKGLAVVPGEAFGKEFKNYIRVSFAAPEEKLKAAISILVKAVEKLK